MKTSFLAFKKELLHGPIRNCRKIEINVKHKAVLVFKTDVDVVLYIQLHA